MKKMCKVMACAALAMVIVGVAGSAQAAVRPALSLVAIDDPSSESGKPFKCDDVKKLADQCAGGTFPGAGKKGKSLVVNCDGNKPVHCEARCYDGTNGSGSPIGDPQPIGPYSSSDISGQIDACGIPGVHPTGPAGNCKNGKCKAPGKKHPVPEPEFQ